MKAEPAFARLLQAYFLERLMRQQQASPHTVASHRDTFCLLIAFVHKQLHIEPSKLSIHDLDAPFLVAFLDHLETERANSPRTRNTRLAAIHSFYRYIAFTEPSLSGIAQRVLAIPNKRYEHKQVTFLTEEEADALLTAPDQKTWTGRRDRLLLLVALQTGLRVSELAGLCWGSIVFDHKGYIRCHGKGRKERCTPLRDGIANALHRWSRECPSGTNDPVFPSSRGGHLSRDGIEYIVTKHATTAGDKCRSLRGKRVSPHVLRHTTAMELLKHGIDRSVIALWLGHESVSTTDVYLHADLNMKERALARTTSPESKGGRYKPDDQTLAFLRSL
jgi:site-specific recombinase XerD